jgi:DNA-binding GntR family transcriptional regulator
MSLETNATSEALSVLRASSLSRVILQDLESRIVAGEFPPGAKLNEKALAERFGVSRGPVREAFQALSATGLVEMVPNRGVFVQRVTRHEAVDIYDVRAGLFGTACRLLAERIDRATIAELRSLHAKMDAAGARRDLESYFPLNIDFHEMIVGCAANAVLAETYRRLVGRLRLYRARGLVHGGGFERSNIEHGRILEALDARDPLAAFEAGYGHVQEGKKRILLAPDAEARTEDG